MAEIQRALYLLSAAMVEGEYLPVDSRIVSLRIVPRTSAAMETAAEVGSSDIGPAAAGEQVKSEGFLTLAVLGMVLAPLFLLGMLVVLMQNRRRRRSASDSEHEDAMDFDGPT